MLCSPVAKAFGCSARVKNGPCSITEKPDQLYDMEKDPKQYNNLINDSKYAESALRHERETESEAC